MSGVDRSRLPGPGRTSGYQPPVFTSATLRNGVTVLTAGHRRAPVLTLRLLVPAGSALDPTERWGLAALTADLLDEGTEERSDVQLHEALTRIGAHLGIEVSSDATVLSLTTLPKHAREALTLLVEVVTRPRFADSECRRVRDLRLNRLQQMRQVPSAVADRVFLESLYGGHPYGHLSIGTEEDLRRIESHDVGAFHRRWFRPTRWTLVAVGDLPNDELQGIAEAVVEETTEELSAEVSHSGPGAAKPPVVAGHRRLVLVPRAGAVQSEIRIGHAGVERRSADYHALLVLNMVLGGQFVSRINLNLREDKGYTYGARTAFDFRLGKGPFSFRSSVQTGATGAAIREVVAEIDAIRGARPVTGGELTLARDALTLGFPRNFETATQVARAGASLALHGLPLDEPARFVERVGAVDAEAVSRVARSHLHPEGLLAAVVGSETDGLTSLRELGFGEATLLD